MAVPQQEKPAGFLQDDNGNNSSMRLMAFISLLAAIGFSGAIFYNTYTSESTRLTLLQQEMTNGQPDVNRLNTLKLINDQTDNGTDGISIIWAFLGVAFGGKFAQKWAELQSRKTDGNNSEEAQPNPNAGAGAGAGAGTGP